MISPVSSPPRAHQADWFRLTLIAGITVMQVVLTFRGRPVGWYLWTLLVGLACSALSLLLTGAWRKLLRRAAYAGYLATFVGLVVVLFG